MEENDILTGESSPERVYPGQTPSQKASSDRMKQWWIDKKAGKLKPKGKPVLLIALLIIGAIGILAYIFRNKLKTLWTNKFKEVLTS
jgi:hypothetical protein